ncbi:hypothetical protein BY996DRAFT_4582138 [Phakopsora pachyrhizi]|nr:hypothetical protein BY996DRAFT_4582138 [Phakopsora pachyrhizi]
MDLFRRKRNQSNSSSSNQPSSSAPSSNTNDQPTKPLPSRPRHSVAVSSLAGNSNRSYGQFSRLQPSGSGGHPYHPIQPRSISASYNYRNQSDNQRPGSLFKGRINNNGRNLSQSQNSPEKPKGRIDNLKRRIVNKLDFSSVMDYPGDKLSELLEYFDLFDFGEMGYSLGFGLNGIHLIVRVIGAIEKARRNLVQSRSKKFGGQPGGGSSSSFADDRLNEARQMVKKSYSLSWLDILWLLSFIMCIYSCYNAYKLFSSKRSYRMHIREDPVNSPNATVVQSPTSKETETLAFFQRFLGLLERLSTLLIGWPNLNRYKVPKPSQVHQLDIWDPDELRLKVFTYVVYPPPQAFLIHYASLTENCMNWALLMIMIMFQTYWIVKFYSQLVKDKLIVQSEVMHEYNTKFVYPKVFPHTKEASTMTNSAEFIRREDWLSY